VWKNVEREFSGRDSASARLMGTFDALIDNVDRTQENILVVEPGSRMWLIDHSRAFRLSRRLPPLPSTGLSLDSKTLDGLRGLTREQLERALGGLLTGGQIKAILARRDRIVDLAVGGDR